MKPPCLIVGYAMECHLLVCVCGGHQWGRALVFILSLWIFWKHPVDCCRKQDAGLVGPGGPIPLLGKPQSSLVHNFALKLQWIDLTTKHLRPVQILCYCFGCPR